MKDEHLEYRAYFFGNMYISPIQHGIQAAHVVTELFVKYKPLEMSSTPFESNVLYRWAEEHKTKMLMNGGYQSNLEKIHKIFEFIGPVLGLPFAKFHEEEEALNGALTSVGVVVPMHMVIGFFYDESLKEFMSFTIDEILTKLENSSFKLHDFEASAILATILRSCKFA